MLKHFTRQRCIWNAHIDNNNNNHSNAECIKLLLKDVIINNNDSNNTDDNDIVIILTIDLSCIQQYDDNTDDGMIIIQKIKNELELLTKIKDILSTIHDDAQTQEDLNGTIFGEAEIIKPIIDLKTNLMINVIMPSSSSSSIKVTSSSANTLHKRQQLQSLLCYYIIKYSYELNCTLAFISDNLSDSEHQEHHQDQYLSISQLRQCLHNILSSHDDTDNNETNIQLSSSSLYTPNNYHSDILFGTIQRNANNNQWNVSTKSLNEILQSYYASTNTTANAATVATEEDEKKDDELVLEKEHAWLQRIQSSIIINKSKITLNANATTSFLKKKSITLVAPGDANKIETETEKGDINNFFSNL